MTRSHWIAALGAVGVSLLTAATARAQAQVVETTAAKNDSGPGAWDLTAGVRTAFIKDPGFDPFSNHDAFAQFSLSASRVIVRHDRAAFVTGLVFDVGQTDAVARDAPSNLSMTRLSALAEARYQPWSRLYGFVRLAPGWLHGSASMNDASAPAGSSLTTTFDAFSVDASAGAAFRFGGFRLGSSRFDSSGGARIGVWLIGDGGYGWAQSERLLLAPDLGADQSKSGALDLGSLAARGGFFRVALALSY
jgi:hypothetical protein